jgi:transposase
MENLSHTPDNSNVNSDSAETRRRRRRFSRRQKLAIIAEADRCTGVADLAALLQREGVFSSHLTVWRKQLTKQAGQKLARPVEPRLISQRDPVIDRLEHENAKLQRELMAANNVIELQRNSLRMPVNEYVARADTGK